MAFAGVEHFKWDDLIEVVAAVGALGAASVGLVDATKFARGGISNAGYKAFKAGLVPYSGAFERSIGPDWEDFFLASWLNGKSKTEQLVAARNFIRLGLTPETASDLAKACAVDAGRLKTVAKKIMAGDELDTREFELVGRMDASVEARLGGAYERADQIYRNSARLLSGVFSVLLALLGWLFILAGDVQYLGLSILTGIVAVPLAPVVKDVISALSATARATKALKLP